MRPHTDLSKKVPGRLNLSHSKIKSLPSKLEVGYELDISHTEITSLPGDLKVKYIVASKDMDINAPEHLKDKIEKN